MEDNIQNILDKFVDMFLGTIKVIVEQDVMPRAVWNFEGYFTYANKQFCDIVGYSLKELLDIPFSDLIYPDDLERAMESYKESSLKDRDIISNFFCRYVKKDGSIIWTKWLKGVNRPHLNFGTCQIVQVLEKDIPEEILKEIK